MMPDTVVDRVFIVYKSSHLSAMVLFDMSQQHLAVVVNVNNDVKTLSVQSIDVPQYDADEVLVEVHAAAQNPTDCKPL